MLDKLVLGLQVTLIGLVIVFIMLFLIIGVIKLLAMIIGKQPLWNNFRRKT